jgi:hypothetical protein
MNIEMWGSMARYRNPWRGVGKLKDKNSFSPQFESL